MAVTTTAAIGAGEAARRLGVSAAYLRHLVADGRIPCEWTPYGRVYDADEVERVRADREAKKAAAR